MENDANIFGIRLKELRTKSKLTQKELSEKINVSATSILSYEKGTKSPSMDIAKEIAAYFNVSLDWLCGVERAARPDFENPIVTVIKFLLEVSKITDMRIEECAWVETQGGNGQIRNDGPAVVFKDIQISRYLDDWKKMLDLLKSQSIDMDLYELWGEKQINNFQKDKYHKLTEDEIRILNMELPF